MFTSFIAFLVYVQHFTCIHWPSTISSVLSILGACFLVWFKPTINVNLKINLWPPTWKVIWGNYLLDSWHVLIRWYMFAIIFYVCKFSCISHLWSWNNLHTLTIWPYPLHSMKLKFVFFAWFEPTVNVHGKNNSWAFISLPIYKFRDSAYYLPIIVSWWWRRIQLRSFSALGHRTVLSFFYEIRLKWLMCLLGCTGLLSFRIFFALIDLFGIHVYFS